MRDPQSCRQELWIVVAALLLAVSGADLRVYAQASPPKAPPTVVFMSDFGVVDDSVALCKGVMYSIAPELRIVDLTHQVTPFSILDGARFLYGATPYFLRAQYSWRSSIRGSEARVKRWW